MVSASTNWYLYVLRCNDGSLYTGATNDVLRRVATHQAGRGARYTRSHLPVQLVAAWRYPDQSAALQAEVQFKRLSRFAKESWVEGRWPFMDAPFVFDVLDNAPDRYHFCPRCGGKLEALMLEGEPVLVCKVCGRRNYYNAKPCAGVLVLRGANVLLVHRKWEPYKGYWDIPGGFLKADELPEIGAARETREETGLDIHIVDFLGFYMDEYLFQEELYSILNIYFVADANGGEPKAGDDADGFQWFPLENLPEKIAFKHEPYVLTDLQKWYKEARG